MKKKIGLLILITTLLCFLATGCEMMNDILSKETGDSLPAEELTESAEATTPKEPVVEVKLDEDSPWWGTFATDGSNFIISEVTAESFFFEYTNIYYETYDKGTATISKQLAFYENLTFAIEGDVLNVSWTKPMVVGEEDNEASIEREKVVLEDGTVVVSGTNKTGDEEEANEEGVKDYWRAFSYTEIDPRPLAEDEKIVPQKDALRKLDAATRGMFGAKFFLDSAGAVEIDETPCWTFSPVNDSEGVYRRAINYAVNSDGVVYLRDDYLSMYVLQPNLVLEFDPPKE